MDEKEAKNLKVQMREMDNRATPSAQGWVDMSPMINYSEERPVATYYSISEVKGLKDYK